MSAIHIVRRSVQRRRVARTINAATAATAIGPIVPGCEIFGVNKGQFSLINIIAHCLEATGPADVLISTWTASGADLGFAYELMRLGQIKHLRFVVDFSFPTRQPEYSAALRERFGDNCIRVTKVHAKFVVIRNEGWNLAIRSSMNFNDNRQLEWLEISDDPTMADFLESIVTELFDMQPAGKGFTNRPYDNCLEFDRLGESGAVEVGGSDSDTDKKYFGDGPLDNDLRRTGWTYAR